MATGALDSLASQLRPDTALPTRICKQELMETLRVSTRLFGSIAVYAHSQRIRGRLAHISCLERPQASRERVLWRGACRFESVLAYFARARAENSTSALLNGAARVSEQLKRLSETVRNVYEASLAHPACGVEGG